MRKEIVSSDLAPRALGGSASQAVKAGPYVFLSGILAPRPELLGDGADSTRPRYSLKVQADSILQSVAHLLDAAGASLDRTVKVQLFFTDLDALPLEMDVRRRYFPDPPPPATAVECGLTEPGAELELDVIGVVAGLGEPETIITDRIPRPLAPYSQATRAGHLIFAAGLLAADYETGVPAEARPVSGLPYFSSAIKSQTRYVLGNVRRLLEAAGSSLEAVVKAHVILTDISDFFAFDEVWREYFPRNPPARSVFESGIVNPGCKIEIDVIAGAREAPEGSEDREVIIPRHGVVPTIAESLAIRSAGLVFVGGQLATDYSTGLAPEARIDPNYPRYATPIGRQGEYVLNTLANILEAAGSSLDDLVKIWIFLTNTKRDLPGLVELLERFFPSQPPAATVIEVPHLIVPDCCIMIDAIALASEGRPKPNVTASVM